ncbi:MAG: class I SAM-dependent methyltransferase [Allosphingosinicella sp.]
MIRDAWRDFPPRRSLVRPPLRPTAEAVATIGHAVVGHDAHVLLLGVTPELYALGHDLTAVDCSPEMIAKVWPGDRKDRRAVLDDWRKMAPEWGPFTAACGDGSLNVLAWPDDQAAVFGRLRRLLAPDARIAIRCYLAPDRPETLAEVREAALSGSVHGFDALKMRVAMTRPGGSPAVPVGEIATAFDTAFPDRAELAGATGWSETEIAAIDFYRGSPAVYSFPTLWELRVLLPRMFATPRFIASGRYELAERCPVLVADFKP